MPGPEILTGSTRLRAGTATKLVLNMISTAVMVKLGHVYGNLMVNVQPTNQKLEDRARRIIQAATGVTYDQAAELLDRAGRSVRVAIVMQKKQITREEAENLLARAKGRIREALRALDKLVIEGGVPLTGEIAVSGSKNAALPALAACLLTAEPVILNRIPQVRDIGTMIDLIRTCGSLRVSTEGGRVTIRAGRIEHPEAPYELVKTMRASSLVLGPLVGRCGKRPRIVARRLRHRRASHQSARLRARAIGRGSPPGARLY